MVNTLLRSMMMLSDVLILFIFFLAVMALIGLQLFAGELRHKCVLNMPQNLSVSYQEYVLNESKCFGSIAFRKYIGKKKQQEAKMSLFGGG